MAHDLGHPPFGHLAEEELSRCIRTAVAEEAKAGCRSSQGRKPTPKQEQQVYDEAYKNAEGYEGNAQSFRIITRLAVRRDHHSRHALDLTRATLNATLKYPLLHSPRADKYGAYEADQEAFAFARAGPAPPDNVVCLEAQIMDWADDITYSVHDVEDFYRAGRIPLDRLGLVTKEREGFRRRVEQRWPKIGRKSPLPAGTSPADIVASTFDDIVRVPGPYDGTRESRAQIYNVSSELIDRFVSETRLQPPGPGVAEALDIPVRTRATVAVLKELIWHYVIEASALATHQHGQREAIRALFRILYEAHGDERPYLFPAAFQDAAKGLDAAAPAAERARLVADAVASLTDQQAIRLYQRLLASAQGSVLDPIVR